MDDVYARTFALDALNALAEGCVAFGERNYRRGSQAFGAAALLCVCAAACAASAHTRIWWVR